MASLRFDRPDQRYIFSPQFDVVSAIETIPSRSATSRHPTPVSFWSKVGTHFQIATCERSNCLLYTSEIDYARAGRTVVSGQAHRAFYG